MRRRIRKGARTGENGKQNDRHREGMHTAHIVSHDAEQVAAEDRTDHRIGRDETAFPESEAEFRYDRRHGERQDQHIQAVHGIAEDGGPHDLPPFFSCDACLFKFQFFQSFF